MSDLATVFLGVIALALVVQAGFVIALVRSGLHLSRRVTDLQQRYERELRPLMDDVSRISRNVAQASDLATVQMRRVDDALANTFDKLDHTTTQISQLLIRPLAPLGTAAALFRGAEKAWDVYRALSGSSRREPRAHAPVRARAVEEDEHLFI